jgi:hypothetical protein
MAQLDHAIDVFERRFPGKIAVFFFDHSSNHCAYPPHALRASQLQWADDSNAKDRPAPSTDGWYMKDGVKVAQVMNKKHGGSGPLVRRGMDSLLTERGKNKKGLAMVCKMCTLERSRGFKGKIDTDRKACCGRRIFETEPDFLGQRTCLEEVSSSPNYSAQAHHMTQKHSQLCIKRGHECKFIPKFHCELNWIEMLFGLPFLIFCCLPSNFLVPL